VQLGWKGGSGSWGVPRSHVYRLAHNGQVPCVRLGRYFRFSVPVIEEFERSGGAPLEETK
jgi:excisionase family DNA binding protein